jgi:hypothetical protein
VRKETWKRNGNVSMGGKKRTKIDANSRHDERSKNNYNVRDTMMP